ncbi:MAG: M20/M25/M40 family metallo-hydrolase [Bacteroidales bacterium]|nr:M20/M25/M40 family metallo-hydrolase [Bacteroidales bacterium]
MKRFSLLLALVCVCAGSVSVDTYASTTDNEKQIARHSVSKKKMLERLLKYISVESWSIYAEGDGKVWTMTDGQVQMAAMLAEDAKALGAEVYVSPDNYVYVTVPSNLDYDVPVVGISCHLDYSCEAPYQGIKPSVTEYKGGDLKLSEDIVLSPSSDYGKDLNGLIGKTLIHSDGTTLLGGDCKNGCAVAMSVLETLMTSDMKHGEVQFVWCPNEDIGLSAERIDNKRFCPEIYYDIDGEGGSEASISNFTAREFYLTFHGKDAHPSDAKALQMGDALAAAAEFVAAIPIDCRPEHSEGEQGYMQAYGFDKLSKIDWAVKLRIRYFDKADGEKYDAIVQQALADVRRDHPNVGIEITTDEIRYDNVALTMHPECINTLKKAAARFDKVLDLKSNRGGTTASMMVAKGLRGGMLVFSGQHVPHTVYEYSVLEEVMDAYKLMLYAIDEVSQLK